MAAINKKVLLLPILRRRLQQAKEKRTSRFWVWDIYKLRKERGEFHSLVKEAALFEHEYFFKLFRMTPRRLDKEKQHTTGKKILFSDWLKLKRTIEWKCCSSKKVVYFQLCGSETSNKANCFHCLILLIYAIA